MTSGGEGRGRACGEALQGRRAETEVRRLRPPADLLARPAREAKALGRRLPRSRRNVALTAPDPSAFKVLAQTSAFRLFVLGRLCVLVFTLLGAAGVFCALVGDGGVSPEFP